jgi:hypothetical protein
MRSGAAAEHLGQAALRGAAQHRHLPQPVLRMGKAQAKEHILIRFAKDMRHVGIGAHDFDRAGCPATARCAIVGERAARK